MKIMIETFPHTKCFYKLISDQPQRPFVLYKFCKILHKRFTSKQKHGTNWKLQTFQQSARSFDKGDINMQSSPLK